MTAISVITPVYNGERFIEGCIKAVLDQDCPEVEHVIMDGGSSDGTVAIIERYARQYPHIRWVSEKDRGQSDAMNKGIALAQSVVVTLLNVDDFYEPNVLNRAAQLLKTLPEPSLLVGNCNIWDDDGTLLGVNRPAHMTLFELLQYAKNMPWPVNPSAYFYHKSLHDAVGLYDVDDHQGMDVDFLLRTVQVAHVKYVDETWGNFRQITGTKTHANFIASYQGYALMEQKMKHFRKDLPPSRRPLVALLFWRNAMKSLLSRKWNRLCDFFRQPGELRVTLAHKWQAFKGLVLRTKNTSLS